VQQLSVGEQLQLLKHVADSLGRSSQPQRSEEHLSVLVADPDMQHERLEAGLEAPDAENSFRRLAAQWLRETEHVSSIKHESLELLVGDEQDEYGRVASVMRRRRYEWEDIDEEESRTESVA
jgi:hypothetical protein